MADINITAVFPSAKFIVTDNKGDLQEVVGFDATSSKGSLQGIEIESVEKGADQNGITFSISENNGSADTLSLDGTDITLDLKDNANTYFLNQDNPETDASVSLQGIKIDAVDSGSEGNGITFQITENNGSADSISATADTITLALDKQATDYKLNEPSIDTSSSASHISLTTDDVVYFIADASLSMGNQTTNTQEDINFTAGDEFTIKGNDTTNRPIIEIGGTDYAFYAGEFKTSWGEKLDSITDIISSADTDVTDLATITITGGDSDSLTGAGSATTAGGFDENPSISSILSGASSDITDLVGFSITGADSDSLTGEGSVTLDTAINAQDGELQSDKSYLLISTDDIADYDGEAEEVDGRKMFYGLLETATANISNLSDKPKNLVVNRGNIILVNESKMRRSYNITATLDILDTDLASES